MTCFFLGGYNNVRHDEMPRRNPWQSMPNHYRWLIDWLNEAEINWIACADRTSQVVNNHEVEYREVTRYSIEVPDDADAAMLRLRWPGVPFRRRFEPA